MHIYPICSVGLNECVKRHFDDHQLFLMRPCAHSGCHQVRKSH